MGSNPFSRPPKGRGPDEKGRVEDAACRAALRMAGLSAGGIASQAGQGPADRLTFAILDLYTEFPANPVVTGVEPDSVLHLMYRFQKSALFEAWLAADGPSALVFRGGEMGVGVMTPLKGKPDRPCVVTGRGGRGEVFAVETFAAWCRSLGWGTVEA